MEGHEERGKGLDQRLYINRSARLSQQHGRMYLPRTNSGDGTTPLSQLKDNKVFFRIPLIFYSII
jgi:hypothetical protein